MTVTVTLNGGPLNGTTRDVDGPWPQAFLVFRDIDDIDQLYQVDDAAAEPDDQTGTADYVSEASESGTATGPYSDDTIGPVGPAGPDGFPGEEGLQGEKGTGFIPRGEWEPDIAYVASPSHDVVTRNGQTYYAMQDPPVGLDPADPDAVATWLILAQRGEPGPAGGNVILDGTTELPQRSKLAFIGPGLHAADAASDDTTVITVTTGVSAAPLHVAAEDVFTVPDNTQLLCALPIQVDGGLAIDGTGVLVQVPIA